MVLLLLLLIIILTIAFQVRSFASKTASPTSATFSLAEKFSVYKPKEDSLFGEGLPTETTASRDDLLRVLRMMLVIRRVEQTCDAEYKQRNIRGFCHLYLGQVSRLLPFLSLLLFEVALDFMIASLVYS